MRQYLSFSHSTNNALMRWGVCTLLFSTLLTGCELEQLRGFFQGESIEEKTTFRLTVQPSRNVSISIDGKQVASASPYEAQLKPGKHILGIKAPGYHPVEMPIMLEKGKIAELPIQMRPLEKAAVKPPIKKKPVQPVAEVPENPPSEQPKVIMRSARPPVKLRLAIDPPGPVYNDGRLVGHGKSVSFIVKKSQGLIQVGGHRGARVLAFTYELTKTGKLYLNLPEKVDGWRRNGLPVSERRRFFLGLQPQRYDMRKHGKLMRGVVFKRIGP